MAPSVLIQDFTASLLAAYSTDEVQQQLREAGMEHVSVRSEDDRYLVVSGLVG
jgi:hypothetical protein